jgi:hypothetical protein
VRQLLDSPDDQERKGREKAVVATRDCDLTESVLVIPKNCRLKIGKGAALAVSEFMKSRVQRPGRS